MHSLALGRARTWGNARRWNRASKCQSAIPRVPESGRLFRLGEFPLHPWGGSTGGLEAIVDRRILSYGKTDDGGTLVDALDWSVGGAWLERVGWSEGVVGNGKVGTKRRSNTTRDVLLPRESGTGPVHAAFPEAADAKPCRARIGCDALEAILLLYYPPIRIKLFPLLI